jgi:thiol-disulfide isomerase/thioredoxin
MKRSVWIVLWTSIALASMAAQEGPAPPSGVELKEETGLEAGAVLARALGLKEQGKTDDALGLLNDALLKHKDKTYDRYALLTVKFELLSAMSRPREALEAAVEKANIVTSPRQALNVAQIYLRLGDRERSLEWLRASVERGLQSYAIFEDDAYGTLRPDPRFRALVDTVMKRNGIGLPAKSFEGSTIAGQDVSLGTFKGKVLLVDFWATWCPPCLAELPNLVKCYGEFRDKGFEIVGFAENDNDASFADFLRKNPIAWPLVAKGDERFEAAVRDYAVKNIPASFLVDKKGILRHVNLTGDALRDAIAQLLKE